MDNPFKDEASAFRLVFLTLAAFAVIVLAGVLINGWAALVAWLVLTGVVVGAFLVRRGSGPPPRQHVPHTGPAAERRVLVVVDETVAALQALAAAIRGRRGERLVGVTGSVAKTTTKNFLKLGYDRPLPVALIRRLARRQLEAVQARTDDGFW